MADTLTLRVLTPRRELCDEPVEQVTAEGTLGQFGVLPDHIAFLTALEPGP
jgi:F-type H+-transporting ATPase subunit epsilon